MRGTVTAAVVSAAITCACACLAAACGARAPEPVERPRASGLTPAAEARENQRLAELRRISRFHPLLDPRQPPAQTPQLVQEAMPPSAVVLPPVRPRMRGDALELADRAFQRGDALDAAAQYRALLDRRDPDIAGYVNVQLAQAYLALGAIDKATWALYEAARSPDVAWYAIAQLAALRVQTLSAMTVRHQLAPLLPSRIDDLENLLIQLARPEEVPELLVAKVQRNPHDPQACGYALSAIARGATHGFNGMGGPCAAELSRAIAIADHQLWLDTRNPSRRLLGANLELWTRSPGDRNPSTWLGAAERAVLAIEAAQNDEDTTLASLNSVLALANVARLSREGVALDGAAIARLRAVYDALPEKWRRNVYSYVFDDPQLSEHVPPPQPEAP